MKIGIITFHHSYNCGSMLQAFAMQKALTSLGHVVQIINFSNKGQHELYSIMEKPSSLKAITKNIVLLRYRKTIENNYMTYERFMHRFFNMNKEVIQDSSDLTDDGFDCIVAGSDQIWNITIADSDDAYFLPWVVNARKVAYAPSFGAKNITRYSNNPNKYANLIKSFDSVSIRERNGQKWINELTGLKVPVVLDPTLLLKLSDYTTLEDNTLQLPKDYIFYYSPGYANDINVLVKNVSKRYNMPVIAFNAKAFHLKGMGVTSNFRLPALENPSTYLTLIKNARIVFTTSFHGTIFSTLYRKTFWTVKNGGMFGDDDRVLTLMSTLRLEDRLIPISFNNNFDYLRKPDYSHYEDNLSEPRKRSWDFLEQALA